MKRTAPINDPNATPRRVKKPEERGVAIITVLSIMLLMTVLVVSFFTMATTELQSAKNYADGLRARSAKDIALNLAIGQLRQATTLEDTVWASQPGAIRVYGMRDKGGLPDSIYKLYSSNEMVVPSFRNIENEIPRDWDNKPAQWVDLNKPVISPNPEDPENVREAELYFPIVDPRALDGDSTKEGSVEGFDFEESRINGISRKSDYRARLPMPVQWLYVLADGTVGHLNSGNQFQGAVQPTRQNPIVSRVAFWTDDETCKVNVNTASEGVFWDTPRVDTDQDRDLGKFQPRNGEFQRYGGHPAMTCLSSVIFPNEGKSYGRVKRLDPEADQDKYEALWTIAPLVGTTGSRGGTVAISDSEAEERVPPVPEDYHLYTSSDEILFGGERMTQNRRTVPRALDSEKVRQRIARGRFFLTAKSRAPEVNMYGHPRISMWPLITDLPSGKTTTFDRLIAFCTTVGGGQFYFQRSNPTSRHWEYYVNANGENNRLWGYWSQLTDKTIPGYGSSMGRKYGQGRFDDRDQICAEILDYMRGTNLFDGNLSEANQYTPGSRTRGDWQLAHGQIAGICLCGGTSQHNRRWSFANRPFPKGMGRMVTISEVAFFAICRAHKVSETEGFGDNEDLEALEVGQKMIEVGFIVETFAPAHGWTSLEPNNSVRIGGGTGNNVNEYPPDMTLNGQEISFRGGSGDNKANRDLTTPTSFKRPKDWIAWGGRTGVRIFTDKKGSTDMAVKSEPIIMPAGSATMAFSGTTERDPLRVILFDQRDNFSVGNLIQSFQIAFPAANFPVPNYWHPDGGNSLNNMVRRVKGARETGIEKYFSKTSDVVHSMVPNHNDLRLISGRRVVKPDAFVPHPDYGSSNKMAHALIDSEGPLQGAKFDGDMLPGINYPEEIRPDTPIKVTDSVYGQDQEKQRGPIDPAITGDFDTGVGPAPDGPHINRPDDGDTRGNWPYFEDLEEKRKTATSYHSPNRIIPSAGMLGSLPTGVQGNVPWNTLLFRPMDEDEHYGATTPPDHLWLDYLWMPVVEPYAISEPFSTAGKINMNYQILPFTYIKRATALHALMKAEMMLAIPNNSASNYKSGAGSKEMRHFINIDETLKQWEEKFDQGKAFRSPSEICEMYLVPATAGMTWSKNRMKSFWDAHKLTGDNVKERPYTNFYPRLTTKSNTYKVHMVAQTLQKVPSSDANMFDPERDQVTGEYRGSAVIERSVNPNDEDIPNYITSAGKENVITIDKFYTYRITNIKQFAP